MKTSSGCRRWLALFALGVGLTVSGCQTVGPAQDVSGNRRAGGDSPRWEESAAPGAVAPGAAGAPAPGDRQTIDLGMALARAGVDNPTIELAREQVREALAQRTAANALLLPSLNAGGNVNVHRGNLQSASGTILDVNRQSLYFGSGAMTEGAQTVAIPGVRLSASLGDAILEPVAASQHVGARTAEAEATQNSVLLRVAVAYLELVGAVARVEALKAGRADLVEVVRLTAAYAKTGAGRQSDADRAAVNAQLLLRQLQDAEGEVVVASARLAGLLSLDPVVRLIPAGGPLVPIRLIDERGDLQPLVRQALADRPELAARTAELAEAHTRVRQEHLRPWLPTLSVGFSAGGFGGGSDLVDYRLSKFGGRTDFDVSAVWTVRNLGLGNAALSQERAAQTDVALAAYRRTEDAIGDEVAEALADAKTAALQIEAATRQAQVAWDGATEEMKRIRAEVARPLEVLASIQQLADFRVELFRAITAYNVAQFRLWTAVGLPPAVPATLSLDSPPAAPDR